MVRFSEEEVYCCDIWWIALDKNGYVFFCRAGGTPNIPEFACVDSDETVFLNRFFLFDFDKEKNEKNVDSFDSVPIEVFVKLLIDVSLADDDDVLLALKGITSFDIVLEYIDPKSREEFNKYPHWYKKVTQPIELLHVDQLPENIQRMLNSRRMNNVDVTKTDYFFVPPNPNY